MVQRRYWLLAVALVMSGMAHVSWAQQSPSLCTAPESRQFDFWLGTWDLSWNDGQGQGTNTITRILDGCIIQENFDTDRMGGQPYQGMSISAYSPALEQWHQTWVDSRGGYLDFTGSFEDGKMILQREGLRNGTPILQRMTWYNITEDELDWDWEVSEDGGTTWQLNWRIHYTRRASADPSDTGER